MAIVKTKLDSLVKRRNHLIIQLFVLLMICIVIGIIIPNALKYKSGIFKNNFKLSQQDVIKSFFGGSIGIVFWWIIIHNISIKIKIINNGIKGERSIIKLLKKLPNNYYIFNDIIIENRDGKSQIDHVVIGTNGIFVIETKNHNGKIVGDENERNWIQNKTGRNGGTYSSELFNPTKQVKTHVYRLKTVLNEELGINPWIQSIVVFANDTTELDVNSKTTMVLRKKDLIKYIKNYTNIDSRILRKNKMLIVNVIKKRIY